MKLSASLFLTSGRNLITCTRLSSLECSKCGFRTTGSALFAWQAGSTAKRTFRSSAHTAGPAPMPFDHYKTLGIPATSSAKQIKAQFRKLTKIYHPDRHANASEDQRKNAHDKFLQIKDAYDVLIDPRKKREYDAQHQRRTMRHGGTGGTSRDAYASNPYATGSERYSRTKSGLNRTRHRAGGFKYRAPEGGNPLSGRPGTGSNYDVPHFDFDKHFAQHLRFEEKKQGIFYEEISKENIKRRLNSKRVRVQPQKAEREDPFWDHFGHNDLAKDVSGKALGIIVGGIVGIIVLVCFR